MWTYILKCSRLRPTNKWTSIAAKNIPREGDGQEMVDLGHGSKFKTGHKDRNIIIIVWRSNWLDIIIDNDALFMIIIFNYTWSIVDETPHWLIN